MVVALSVHEHLERADDARDQQKQRGGFDQRQNDEPHLLQEGGAVQIGGFKQAGGHAQQRGQVDDDLRAVPGQQRHQNQAEHGGVRGTQPVDVADAEIGQQ